MIRQSLIGLTLLFLLTVTGCGKPSTLELTGNLRDEAKNADLAPYKDEIIQSYDQNPLPMSPSKSPQTGSLQEKLKSLGGMFNSGQGGGGQMLLKVLGALCKVQSMQSQNKAPTSYSQQRGVQRFGSILKKIKERLGSLMQANMGGTGASGYPQLPQMGGQLRSKLQTLCQDPSKLTNMMSTLGQGSTMNQSQMTDAIGDLGSATSSIQDQLYGY